LLTHTQGPFKPPEEVKRLRDTQGVNTTIRTALPYDALPKAVYEDLIDYLLLLLFFLFYYYYYYYYNSFI
jgi:hypothetical protein